MKTLLRFRVWLVALAVVATTARAATLEQLLERELRPTMQDMHESWQTLVFPPEIPARRGVDPRNHQASMYNFAVWLKSLLDHGPKLVAALEKTFPGGRYAFVGRDTQLIADLVEAFYLSIGQTGRVVRLGVSKPTFAQVDEPTLLAFLEGHGLNVRTATSAAPFIFIDTVSQGFGRQARLMLDAVYRSAREAGIAPAALVRRVNIFGLVVSTFRGTPNPFTEAEKHLREHEKLLEQNAIAHFGNEHRIITFADPGSTFNESGYEHYTSSWHGTYGPLQRLPDGRVVSTPGPALPRAMRASILWTQRELYLGVQRPEFLAAVKEEARALGYEFPMTMPAPQPPPPPPPPPAPLPDAIQAIFSVAHDIDKHLATLPAPRPPTMILSLIQGMKKAQPRADSLSENGMQVATWMQLHRASFDSHEWSLLMMRAARAGRHGLRLRSEDLRMMLAEAFATPPSYSFLKEALEFAEEAKAFRDLLTSDTWLPAAARVHHASVQAVWNHATSCPNLIARTAR